MKFTGNHFGLTFLTSAEMEPNDFLEETAFMLKFSTIFAPWEEAITSVEIPTEDEMKKLCTTVDMCNITVNNFQGYYYVLKRKFNRIF